MININKNKLFLNLFLIIKLEWAFINKLNNNNNISNNNKINKRKIRLLLLIKNEKNRIMKKRKINI